MWRLRTNCNRILRHETNGYIIINGFLIKKNTNCTRYCWGMIYTHHLRQIVFQVLYTISSSIYYSIKNIITRLDKWTVWFDQQKNLKSYLCTVKPMHSNPLQSDSSHGASTSLAIHGSCHSISKHITHSILIIIIINHPPYCNQTKAPYQCHPASSRNIVIVQFPLRSSKVNKSWNTFRFRFPRPWKSEWAVSQRLPRPE